MNKREEVMTADMAIPTRTIQSIRDSAAVASNEDQIPLSWKISPTTVQEICTELLTHRDTLDSTPSMAYSPMPENTLLKIGPFEIRNAGSKFGRFSSYWVVSANGFDLLLDTQEQAIASVMATITSKTEIEIANAGPIQLRHYLLQKELFTAEEQFRRDATQKARTRYVEPSNGDIDIPDQATATIANGGVWVEALVWLETGGLDENDMPRLI